MNDERKTTGSMAQPSSLAAFIVDCSRRSALAVFIVWLFARAKNFMNILTALYAFSMVMLHLLGLLSTGTIEQSGLKRLTP